MRTNSPKMIVGVAAVGAAVFVATAGAALAISTGTFSPAAQGCPKSANANTFLGAYPDCKTIQVTVTDTQGRTYAEAGLNQVGNGPPPNTTSNPNDPGTENYHSGTILITPNGDGNPYGLVTGSPYNNGQGCPTADEFKPADPGETETDQGCPTDVPAAGPVTGPAIGGKFDTNYQPIPHNQCGVEDIGLYAVEEIEFLAGLAHKPCTLDPTKWQLPSQVPSIVPVIQSGAPGGNAASLLTSGGQLYIGGDDNGDSGEHDGVDGQYGTGTAYNGPSDGGSFGLTWSPTAELAQLSGIPAVLGAALGNPKALAAITTNPLPLVTFGGGACADGICAGGYTSQRTVYTGGGGLGNQRDVYNYAGKDFGPYNCNSGDVPSEKACTTDKGSNGTVANACPAGNDANAPGCGMNAYRAQEAKNVTTEPGAIIYADPDPEASPVLPPNLDPLTALYVGSCGIVIGGGGVTVPATPLTNSAGQLVLSPTGC